MSEYITLRNDDLLTIAEVAEHLRVDATTVRRWVNNGSLPALLLPGRPEMPQKRQKKHYRIKVSTLLEQGLLDKAQ